MKIWPRSTPEVPHRNAALPAPVASRTDSVALTVPDPAAGYKPFAPPDVSWTRMPPSDPCWSAGPVSDDRNGTRLPDGTVRYGRPGAGRMEGLTVDGQPATYHWKGHNYWWMLSLDDVADNLLMAGDEASKRVGKGTVTSINGQRVTWEQREAAAGTRRLVVALPGSHTLHVTSAKPLKDAAIHTLCSAFAECPPVSLRGLRDVFVVESLGEKVDDSLQGPAHPLSAITRAGIPDITFVHDRLCDPVMGRHVVLHEVGHLVDGLDSAGCVSAVQTDDRGRQLFGTGGPVEAQRELLLSRDPFVSHYASLSGKEDFAETHALVLQQRTAFNLANPGHDLLLEPLETSSAYLSPRLGLKAEAVVERYRELGHEPAPKGFLTRLKQRLGFD